MFTANSVLGIAKRLGEIDSPPHAMSIYRPRANLGWGYSARMERFSLLSPSPKDLAISELRMKQKRSQQNVIVCPFCGRLCKFIYLFPFLQIIL